MTDAEFEALPAKEKRRRTAMARRMLQAWMLQETRHLALGRCANTNDPPCFRPCDDCWQQAHGSIRAAMLAIVNE
jgi:hypothetical protein